MSQKEKEQIIRTEYSDVMKKSYIDLCHERHYFQSAAGCTGRTKAGAEKGPL